MMKKIGVLCILLCLFIFTGCTPPPAATPQVGTTDTSPTTAPPSTNDTAVQPTAAVATPGGGDTPAVVPTPTEIPRPTSEASVCVAPSEHGPLELTTYAQYPQIIMDYLNSGASPEELAVELIINQLSPDEQPVWAEDLTRDGVRDVVVTVLDKENHPGGALMIFTCNGSEYVLSHIVVAPQDYYAPKLLHIQDMNNDGLREVIYSSTVCIAHTCYEDIQIINWASGIFVPRLEGSTADLPIPEVQLTDFDQDGIYDLEVVGKFISDVAAGPQRMSINIWTYDPNSTSWRLTEQSLASSPFRIHLVHDAEDAMDRGEYLIAALLFQQVIDDDSLLDWRDATEERNTLSAYAYYKQIVANVFLGDRATAQALYDEFVELYGDTAQSAYVEMAEIFLTDSDVLGTEGGCASARQYAAANEYVILTPLGSSVYGYTNRDFTSEDVCP